MGEQPAGLFEGAGRDAGGESAGLERDRLGNGIDRGRGAAQGKAGLESEGIRVWFAAEVDLERGVEG
jgi:hypothetical protein